jgi:hypothetical protein
MIETMFVEMPLAVALGVVAGFATRGFVGLSVRRLLSYAAFVGATLAPMFWMLPLMMDRAAAFPVYVACRDLSLAVFALLAAWSFETWSPVLRTFFGVEQIGMLLRYAIWYGLAPQALCTAWDASEQRLTGLGLLLTGVCLTALYVVKTLLGARQVQPA